MIRDPQPRTAEEAAERYARLPRPLFTKLPFDYRRVPIGMRVIVLRILANLARAEPSFPAWPIEASLDADRLSRHDSTRTATLLITHDVDTGPELELISAIRDEERRFGIVSSWGFVPAASWPTETVARRLVSEGCEVYWHDLAHDGRLPYMGLEPIKAAFAAVDRRSPWAVELMRSFRSGQLLMSPELLAAVADRFDVDLSMPDTEKGGPYGGTVGCGTVVPFRIEGCLEIPLSMPQDVFLRSVYGLDAQEALEVWRRKLAHVIEVRGVAVLNLHPMWVNPSTPDMWDVYRTLLAEVAARPNLRITTPSALRTEF